RRPLEESMRRKNTRSGMTTLGLIGFGLGIATTLLVTANGLVGCSSDDDANPTPGNNGVPSPVDGSVPVDEASVAADGSASDGASAEATTEPGDAGTDSTTDGSASDGTASDAGDGAAPTGPCSSLPGTIVYVESGDTQENLLKNLGRKLRDTANITL